ncbi:hypothetical protein GCM10011611_36910 [Aliidongia dinghuensis]|uniref:Glycosyltransferase family 9 protein n=1 Tax=Aliidongia dinghuensis TaxID=1867774 RepID=A0A8J3E674_9PROT|nr:glycosyltransferase family 9 protein [Aliidongia dinghuensis]GGF27509.1 hypothetical protein GCM10011611_36910 [Aliidongia dinghuensis]
MITTGLVEARGRPFPDARVSIFTRPHFRSLYQSNPHVSAVYAANFPMGTDKRFGIAGAMDLLRQVWKLRRRRFDCVINLGGDFRENLLSWLISPRGTVSPYWEAGHPFRRMIREGLGSLRAHPVPIERATLNIYDAQECIARTLGATGPAQPRLYMEDGEATRHAPTLDAIGLHVSASLECKQWPLSSWRALIAGIRARGFGVRIFAAPDERASLMAGYGDVIDAQTELITGSLRDFFEALSRVRAVVCLDSFSIHAAYAIGVPSIMLNGSHLAEMVLPPGAELVNGGLGLACAPCMNSPTCGGSDKPYQCIRGISADAVLERLDRLDRLCSASTP